MATVRPYAAVEALLDDAERSRLPAGGPARDVAASRAALLRALLTTVVGGPAGPVTRTCATCGGPHGRPVVAGGPWVSASGAGDVVAAAVTTAGPVGVDVERVARAAFAGFAAVALAPGERAVGDAERARTWARKEAVLKATGDGLAVDPAALRLSGPRRRPRLLDWPAAPGPVHLHDVHAPDGFVCSAAVLGRRPARPTRHGDLLRQLG